MIALTSKTCRICEQTKLITSFYLQHGRPSHRCKECTKASVRIWQSANRARVSAIKRKSAVKLNSVDRVRRRARYWLKQYGETLPPGLDHYKDKYRQARALGYRSMLEVNVARQLTELGVPFEYESIRIPYIRDSGFIFDEEDLQ